MEGGVNWMPVIAVLVILYLVVMGIVVASFYCWNKAQTPRQSEKAPLAAAASQGTGNNLPTAGPARPVYTDGEAYYSYRVERGQGAWKSPTSGWTRPPVTPQQKMEFVRKLYAILSTQILLTVLIVVGLVALSFKDWDPATLTTFGSGLMDAASAVLLVTLLPMLILICVLFYQKNVYPLNYILLFVFTVLESFIIGIFCVLYYANGHGEPRAPPPQMPQAPPPSRARRARRARRVTVQTSTLPRTRAGLQIIISALLTCFIFITLTIFTFFSKVDFGFLGPFLFASTLILIFWGLILGFISAFSTVSIGVSMAFSLFGALIFCGFIVRRAAPPLPACYSSRELSAAPALHADLRHQPDHQQDGRR